MGSFFSKKEPLEFSNIIFNPSSDTAEENTSSHIKHTNTSSDTAKKIKLYDTAKKITLSEFYAFGLFKYMYIDFDKYTREDSDAISSYLFRLTHFHSEFKSACFWHYECPIFSTTTTTITIDPLLNIINFIKSGNLNDTNVISYIHQYDNIFKEKYERYKKEIKRKPNANDELMVLGFSCNHLCKISETNRKDLCKSKIEIGQERRKQINNVNGKRLEPEPDTDTQNERLIPVVGDEENPLLERDTDTQNGRLVPNEDLLKSGRNSFKLIETIYIGILKFTSFKKCFTDKHIKVIEQDIEFEKRLHIKINEIRRSLRPKEGGNRKLKKIVKPKSNKNQTKIIQKSNKNQTKIKQNLNKKIIQKCRK